MLQQDVIEPAVLAEAAQVHIGVDAWYDARLAVLPDGELALPVDLGLAVGVAADVEVVFVEVRRQVLVIESHGAVDHGLHAIVVLNEFTELVHTVDELAA